MVSANDAEAADGQSLGRVTLCQDEGALVGAAAAGVIGVIELGDACRSKGSYAFMRASTHLRSCWRGLPMHR